MGLVGRESQQGRIATLIDEARQGRSGVLAVVGEAGMGKSALLGYATHLASGMNVLSARGVQSEARIPFAGLSELLRPALGKIDRIPPPQAAALEGALALIPARTEDRFAVGAATLSLLSAYAEDRPLLVVIDDVHWIDGSSTDAISFAMRRLVADPLAVLLGVRGGEPSLLDGIDVPRLRLDGLDLIGASQLITDAVGTVPRDVIERVHRHTGGNPLALLEAALEIDRFRHGAPMDMPLPLVTSVSDVYLARTRALGAACRQVLLLASASDVGELTILARAARLLDLDLADLVGAEDSGLIELREGRVEFRHPLIRSAVYNDASAQDRRLAHKALAGALPDTDSDRRAWHLALAALGPDEVACSALEQAALRSRDRNAYDVASRAFERAAQLAPEERRQASLLYEAASSAWSAGHAARAKDLLDEAAKHTTDERLGIALEHLRGQTAARLGPVSAGVSILLAASERASRTDPELAVVMLAEAVNASFYAADTAAMQAAAERIAGVDPDLLTDRGRFFATMAQGMALIFSTKADEGASLVRRAVQLAEPAVEAADDPIWLTWAAMGSLWLRESGSGRALIDRATDVARSRTALGILPYLLSHVAVDHATTHRWAEAEAAFHEILELSRETHQLTDRATALCRLACLEARQGKEELCLEHSAEAIRLANALNLRLCEIWAWVALGDLCLSTGRTAEAIEHFTRQRALLHDAGIFDVDLSPAPELVELHLREGNTDAALELAAAYGADAIVKGQPWALARAARCEGLLVEDDLVDDRFGEALEAHGRTLDVFETARTRLAYGSRLRRSRQRVRAREQLRTAIDVFDSLGSKPWSTMARVELAATGETARQRDDSTRSQLTPQELQVALLLAGRHTTRQTAAALFLSPKTVEYHLRNVYRKLGCNTREDLAIALDTNAVQDQTNARTTDPPL